MPSTRLHHTHGELLTKDMSGSHPTWSTSLGFCCSSPREDPKALFSQRVQPPLSHRNVDFYSQTWWLHQRLRQEREAEQEMVLESALLSHIHPLCSQPLWVLEGF